MSAVAAGERGPGRSSRAAAASERWYGRASYVVARLVVFGFGRIWWRLTVSGREHLPDGPFVLSPVHRSYIDTPLMAAIPRRLKFLGKAEMWDNAFIGAVCSYFGGIPVERGTADRDALARIIGAVEAGRPVVLFPEGTRRDGPELFPFYEGPSYVAAKAQVPIVPVGIGGSARSLPRSARFLRPTRIHIIIGEPIPPPAVRESGRISRAAVSATTARLADEVQRLFDAAQAHVGTPNR